MDYQTILRKVIEDYFPKNKFNSLGKLEWYPVTERQKKDILKKRVKNYPNKEFNILLLKILVLLINRTHQITVNY